LRFPSSSGRPDERLADSLPLERGKDGDGRQTHTVQQPALPLDDGRAEAGIHMGLDAGPSPA